MVHICVGYDGTPTMGGALILFAITVSTLLWADLSNRFIWVVLFVTLGYGSIGWIDDYRKVVHHNPKGMSAREKFSWQSVIGLAAAFYLVFALSVPAGGTLTETIAGWVEAGFPLDISSNLHLLIPCFKDIALPLGLVGFMVFTYVVIVGSSNAVNLTDGLDGLAILPSVMVGGALVDAVFRPMMRNPLPWLETLFGRDEGSGAACFYAALALMGVLTCLFFQSRKSLKTLEGDKAA